MSNLFLEENYTEVRNYENEKGEFFTENILLSEPGHVFESYTDKPGELFRSLRKEHGRCTGHVYRDRPDGGADKIGWVFEKRRRYQDSPETYIQHVWCVVHDKPPTIIRQDHVHVLS